VTTTDEEQIAAVLQKAAVLLVRHLNYGQGQSLTSSTVLALLDDEGPVRISALTAASGVTRLSDPQDARATLVDITARGRARRAKLQTSIHDRLVELLDMLPAESRATLSLAMRVAAPLIDQLTQLASRHPDSSVDRA
jgi:hypothetical protein